MWYIPLKTLTLKCRIDSSPFNLLACLLLSVVLSLCCCESGCCHSCSRPPSLCVWALSLLWLLLKDQAVKDKALQSMASMSSAQIVSATAIHNKLGLPGIPRPAFPRPEVTPSHMAASHENTPDRLHCTLNKKKRALPNVEHLIPLSREQLLTWMTFAFILSVYV